MNWRRHSCEPAITATRVGGAAALRPSRLLAWRLSVWFFSAVVLLASHQVFAAQDDAENAPPVQVINRESQFKAAFLFNFGHYIEWPDDVTATADVPFVIGVVGAHDAVAHLQRIAAARKRKSGKQEIERPIEIRQFDTPEKASAVHVLFVPSTVPAAKVRALASAVADRPTLLVGEDDAFLDNGGAINLGRKADKIHLSISLPGLAKAGLKPSSALLRITPDVRK